MTNNVIPLFPHGEGGQPQPNKPPSADPLGDVNALKNLSISEILDRILSLTEQGMSEQARKEITNGEIQTLANPLDILSFTQPSLQKLGFPDNAIKMILLFQALDILKREATPANVNFSDKITTVLDHIEPLFQGLRNEEFWVFYLDRGYNLIAKKHHQTGTRDDVDVDVDEIIKCAENFKAAAIVVAHNHPKGPTRPSEEDISLTAAFLKKCREAGIKLADHFVVSSSGVPFTSIREHVRENGEWLGVLLQQMFPTQKPTDEEFTEALNKIREQGKIDVDEGLIGIAFDRQYN